MAPVAYTRTDYQDGTWFLWGYWHAWAKLPKYEEITPETIFFLTMGRDPPWVFLIKVQEQQTLFE